MGEKHPQDLFFLAMFESVGYLLTIGIAEFDEARDMDGQALGMVGIFRKDSRKEKANVQQPT